MLLLTALGGALGFVGLGVDLGTSGVRICCVEVSGRGPVSTPRIIHEDERRWSDDEGSRPQAWLDGVQDLLRSCSVLDRVDAVAVSGTSASALVIDAETGGVTRPPRMYNYQVEGDCGDRAMALIEETSPPGHTTRARTSAFAKLLSWQLERPLAPSEKLVHQADYVATALSLGVDGSRLGAAGGEGGGAGGLAVLSDWHNALKLGYDVGTLEWPAFLLEALGRVGLGASALPDGVLRPGEAGPRSVGAGGRRSFGLREGCAVVGGTTDSIAAFFASGCDAPGQAVTSLGSTLAVKLLSAARVDDAAYGIYSHRYSDDLWLVGGASNVGCRIFRHLDFSDAELRELSDAMAVPDAPTNALDYYPLVDDGERFPVCDPGLKPRLSPLPEDRGELLRNLLLGLSDVERMGFEKLAELGATPLEEVFTAGGGAKNDKWMLMRSRMLGVSVSRAANVDASFGAAVLAVREAAARSAEPAV